METCSFIGTAPALEQHRVAFLSGSSCLLGVSFRQRRAQRRRPARLLQPAVPAQILQLQRSKAHAVD